MKKKYTKGEIDIILARINSDYNAHYVIEGNDETLHFRGFSNRETKWRLEPYFTILMECPNKYNIHIDSDGSWNFWRIPDKRTATA